MDQGKTWTFGAGCSHLLTKSLVLCVGLILLGQGCTDVSQFVRDGQREQKLAKQMEWAEDELKKGNLHSARTVLDWVHQESKRPSRQERALFFSGFTASLDKGDANRLERGRVLFASVSETFPEGEFGQISEYIAVILSDAASSLEAIERENTQVRQEIAKERSHRREIDQLIQKEKKQLSKRQGEIAALKKLIALRDKEIESLKVKISKLEEIHKEIKKKRKSIS